eukprot:761229-Hanusia_phi.AAC.2
MWEVQKKQSLGRGGALSSPSSSTPTTESGEVQDEERRTMEVKTIRSANGSKLGEGGSWWWRRTVEEKDREGGGCGGKGEKAGGEEERRKGGRRQVDLVAAEDVVSKRIEASESFSRAHVGGADGELLVLPDLPRAPAGEHVVGGSFQALGRSG